MKKNNLYNFAEKIIHYPRSLTGPGVRETLISIKRKLKKLRINSFNTNSKVFDWKIPKEWRVEDAYIISPSGKKICDYKKNKLHLVGYSIPIDKLLKKKQLDKKLFSLPKQPNAIPYITSYYKKNWGFCIKHKDKVMLRNGNYRAIIKSRLTNGKLQYGELIINGKSKKEILLTTYVCHPQMANNETSGISVLTFLSDWIQKKKRNFTYRILFIPETIGSIAYISKHYKKLKKNLIAGFVITCVGDEGKFSYVPSRNGGTTSDVVAKKILDLEKKSFVTYTWLDRGSDERQFCAPGIDLPVCSITKSKYGTYREYHTSLDKLGNVVTSKGLNKSLKIYKKVIDYIDSKYHPNLFLPSTRIFCEPQMGKRGLYPNLSTKDTKDKIRLMMDVLSYCDGKTSIIQIANFCKVSENRVLGILKILKKNKIII